MDDHSRVQENQPPLGVTVSLGRSSWLRTPRRFLSNRAKDEHHAAHEHLVRYYGWYSHRCRGARAAKSGDNSAHIDRRLLEEAKTDAARRRQARSWAMLIQRVWEVDPLKCAKCGGQMQVVSFIEARQEEVIRRILEYCGLWQGPPSRLPPARPPPARRQRPPPREVQLVLDPEFIDELPTSGPSPPGRHLVPDRDHLADRHREADAREAAVSID